MYFQNLNVFFPSNILRKRLRRQEESEMLAEPTHELKRAEITD